MGFETRTLDRAIEDFNKEKKVIFYGWKFDRCNRKAYKFAYTVLFRVS